MDQLVMKKRGRGRPSKTTTPKSQFNPNSIQITRGSDLSFSDELFNSMKTNTELDVIFSTEGGLMPGTNMMIAGGPGSGKSTVTLDLLSNLVKQGYKCLFVSGEMDEIAYYKYCKRIPHFSCVPSLFLKNYHNTVKETIEYVFDQGYDVVVIDSIAEVLEMYKDTYKVTKGAAESWFLGLQDKMKMGGNKNKYYTTFINIQQMTKADEFVGSNRLKHMVDAFAKVEKSKDGFERSIHFEKNRDCDKDFKIFFSIYNNEVHYSYETIIE